MSGEMKIAEAPYFEDTASLKQWVRNNANWNRTPQQVGIIISQTGSASEVELEEKGGLTIADIAAEGACYCWEETDTASDQGKVVTMTYVDDAGAIHIGYATLTPANTTIECQFMTTSGGATPIADFFRRRLIDFPQVAGKYIAIGATGKGTVYGVIEEGLSHSLHSRYVCPVDRDAWLAEIRLGQSISAVKTGYLKISYIPFGETTIHNIKFPIPNNNVPPVLYPMIRLAENTEIKFEVKSDAAFLTANIKFIEGIQS